MEPLNNQRPGLIQKENLSGMKINSKKKKKSGVLKYLFAKDKDNVDLSGFDANTGDKVASLTHADFAKQKAMMEVKADAARNQAEPVDKGQVLKDGATGASLSTLAGHVLLGDRTRTKGLIGLATGLGVGAISAKRQINDYNKQMAAREALVGQHTGREKAYLSGLKNKYGINRWVM